MDAYRFLINTHVDQSDIISHLHDACLDNVLGKANVCMKKKSSHSGVVSHHQCSTFLHPLLVVNTV